MHLNSEELVDIAEGTRLEGSVPHLADCESCRAQLRDLRLMLSAAQDADVPEPSPLFWDHLSSRVSEAVAVEAIQKPARVFLDDIVASLAQLLSARAFQAGFVVAAALLLVVFMNGRTLPSPTPASTVSSPGMAIGEGAAAVEPLVDVTTTDDASLSVVASFTDGQDLETVREAGLAPRGTAEHAVSHMSEGELRELGRLLKEELTRPGA